MGAYGCGEILQALLDGVGCVFEECTSLGAGSVTAIKECLKGLVEIVYLEGQVRWRSMRINAYSSVSIMRFGTAGALPE